MQNDSKHLFVLSGIAKNPVYINSDNSSMIQQLINSAFVT